MNAAQPQGCCDRLLAGGLEVKTHRQLSRYFHSSFMFQKSFFPREEFLLFCGFLIVFS